MVVHTRKIIADDGGWIGNFAAAISRLGLLKECVCALRLSGSRPCPTPGRASRGESGSRHGDMGEPGKRWVRRSLRQE
jgi:hypothetical protein